MKNIFLVCLSLIVLVITGKTHADNENLYVTWEGSEPDKGASVWLIKTFINKQATFLFQKPGTEIVTGQAFDVPQSKYRRSHRYTTFESLLQDYSPDDPVVKEMAKIIHDLEINTWGEKVVTESVVIEQQYRAMGKAYGRSPIPFECGEFFFENVYRMLKNDSKVTSETTFIPKDCLKETG